METIKKDGFNLVRQTDGPDLGYSPTSGVKIIEVDGKAFKSFDGSDTLLPYEDWRLPMEERAADLAAECRRDCRTDALQHTEQTADAQRHLRR